MASPSIMRKRLAIDRQQLLILAVAALMVGSFCLLVLWPQQQELSLLGSAVSRQRDEVTQKVRASHDGIYVSARISALRKVQASLARRLPDEPRLAEFLAAVAECVRAEPGVSHEIQRTEMKPGDRTPAVPLRLRLAGPFEAVHRCLAGIENLERLNRIRHVHVSRADETGQVVAEADILVYYLPAETPGAALTERAEPSTEEVVRG